MKIRIKTIQPIYGMADALKAARRKLESMSDMIEDHLIKAVVYDYTTNDFDHWVRHELATWIFDASQLRVKTKTGKLSQADYANYLFQSFGEDEHDIGTHLSIFYHKYVSSKQYPDFNMSWKLVTALTYAENTVRSSLSSLLSQKQNVSKKEIEDVLIGILQDAIAMKDELV